MWTGEHKNNIIYMGSSEVCMKTRSPPASFQFIGQITEHAIVKWALASVLLSNLITNLFVAPDSQSKALFIWRQGAPANRPLLG